MGLKRSPDQAQFLATLIALLQTRGQFLGRFADYERTEELTNRLISVAPQDPQSYLARAGIRSTFHQFLEALRDLDEAERLGASAAAVNRLRASICQAQGNLDRALPLWKKAIEDQPDIISLGSAAVALAETGETSGATQLFDRALQEYRDVSPFPVAWIEFQRGLMLERAGRIPEAREQYEMAHARLPRYAAATGHLAASLSYSGDRSRAITLLERLLEQTDDPEYSAQLAGLLVQQGDFSKAGRLRAAARQGYERLSERHPEAFADHAARFWLDENPSKALALAQKNLAIRKTADAYELALTCALQAHDNAVACPWADEALKLSYAPSRLKDLADRVLAVCGRTLSDAAVFGKPSSR